VALRPKEVIDGPRVALRVLCSGCPEPIRCRYPGKTLFHLKKSRDRELAHRLQPQVVKGVALLRVGVGAEKPTVHVDQPDRLPLYGCPGKALATTQKSAL
jgi:hypothetical protein